MALRPARAVTMPRPGSLDPATGQCQTAPMKECLKRLPPLAVALLLGCHALAIPPAHAQVESWNDPCKRLLKEYKQRPAPKAFALTTKLGNDTSQYCGAAWGAASKQDAEAQAKSTCMTKSIGRSGNTSVPLPANCGVVRSE